MRLKLTPNMDNMRQKVLGALHALLPSFHVRDIHRLFRVANISYRRAMLVAVVLLMAANLEFLSFACLSPMTTMIAARGEALESPTIPLLGLRLPIDKFFLSQESYFLVLGGLILILTLGHLTLNTVGRLLFQQVRVHGVNRLRGRLFERFLETERNFLDKQQLGKVTALISIYPREISELLESFRVVGESLLTLILYTALMLSISGPLTAIALLILPAMHFAVRHLLAKMEAVSVTIVNATTQLNKRLSEILSCIPLVKLMAMEEEEAAEMRAVIKEEGKTEIRMSALKLLSWPIQEYSSVFFLLVLATAIYFFGSHTRNSVGSYFVFLLLVRKAFNSVSALNGARTNIISRAGYVLDLTRAFDETGAASVSNGTVQYGGLTSGIELRNLTFRYSQTGEPALKKVSLKIGKGMQVAIVGRTGSGKSTIVSLLLGFYHPPRGTMFLNGIDILDYDTHSLRTHCAVVTQVEWLFNRSIRFNLIYGLKHDVSDEEIYRVLRASKLEEKVRSLPQGIETEIGERGIRLSGGEKQRISLARALLRRAEIIVLDEATSAMDVHTEAEIHDSIQVMFREKTVITIAHRLSTIAHADHVVVLSRGEVAEQGKPSQLLKRKGSFTRMWEINQKRSGFKRAG